MLDELHVRDIALIEDATLSFSSGLTVLTGETGAGKTALLSALQLVCGMRASATCVRDGASQASAEARFIDAEGEHVVARRLSAGGRSRCCIDGSLATVGELAQAGACVRMHGQHEHVELLDASVQLAYLDSSISSDGSHRAAYAQAREAYLQARERYESLARADERAGQQLEFMRFTAGEIAKVAPQAGEYEQLEAELPRLQHAQRLAQGLSSALSQLYDDDAALDAAAGALAELQRHAGIDASLDELAARLADVLAQLEDVSRDIAAYAATLDADPQRLQDTLDRLAELSGLMKRFGPGMQQVLDAWSEANAALQAAQASPERLGQARRDMLEAQAAYERSAAQLAELRQRAAGPFCEELAACVHELAMPGASFRFSFEPLAFEQWGEAGSERVELLYSPAAGASARPLRRIASGGELSRVLLALECMHAAGEGGQHTIVFDEVDAGIGGGAGQAVARALERLARTEQVIVITHLAQVAARASRHFVVAKHDGTDGHAHTQVIEVTGAQREAEIARMLAGDAHDEVALEHARSLLAAKDGRRA